MTTHNFSKDTKCLIVSTCDIKSYNKLYILNKVESTKVTANKNIWSLICNWMHFLQVKNIFTMPRDKDTDNMKDKKIKSVLVWHILQQRKYKKLEW